MGCTAGVDLGKTGCRARVVADGRVVASGEADGAPGLAEPAGVDAAVAAVLAALPGAPVGAGLAAACVGAAGATAAPEAARSLAERLAERLEVPVAVTSDAVTSHAGALGGRHGTVVAAGTGAVAVALGTDGEFVVVDGWGQWLGDEGSGSWIGREGLRCVARAADGRGPATSLSALAERRYGPVEQLPSALAAAPGGLARATAAFAPDVVGAAGAGDAVAHGVVAAAVVALAHAAVTAAGRAPGAERVALVGGLARSGELLVAPWQDAVRRAGLVVTAPEGDSVDGAVLLAVRDDLPHEQHVHRARGALR